MFRGVGFKGRSKVRSFGRKGNRENKFLSLFSNPMALGLGDGGNVVLERLGRVIYSGMVPIIWKRKGACVHGTNPFE